MTQTKTMTPHINHNNAELSQKVLMMFMLITSFVFLAFTSIVNAETTQRPDLVISQTTERMLDALKQDRELIRQHPNHINKLANNIIMPHVDFQRMSSWVLGKHWRRATAEQKERFPAQFRSLILRTYATALSEYTSETINYLPLRAKAGDTDVMVKTIIERSAGPNIPVAYRMHLSDAGWKVYDISIDGISLVNNYRRSFSSEIRRRGLDSLINKLTAKNRTINVNDNQLASK